MKMGQYIVNVTHTVEKEYDWVIEADSPEEARRKAEEFDFESEHETDEQGLELVVNDVKEKEDGEYDE
jgi:hypothetical protein